MAEDSSEKAVRPTKRDTAAARKERSGNFDNEDIIRVNRQFPIVMRRPLIYGMLILVVGLLPWAFAFGNMYSWAEQAAWWLIFCIIVLILYWLRTWVGWYFTVFVLTDKRVVMTRQKGLFDRTVSELALNNIQNVTYAMKGVQAAMFHFGDITIATLSGAGNFEMKYVHRPERFAKAIIRAAGLSGSTPTAE